MKTKLCLCVLPALVVCGMLSTPANSQIGRKFPTERKHIHLILAISG